jgi:hypothetical protein
MADIKGEAVEYVVRNFYFDDKEGRRGAFISLGITGEPTVESGLVLPPAPVVAPTPVLAVPSLVSADVWAFDTIQLNFSRPMLVSSLLDIGTYTVTPDGNGAQVTVLNVLVTRGAHEADSLFLIVTPFTVGEIYTVKIDDTVIVTADGTAFSAYNAVKFRGRKTKIDSVLATRPGFYDISPTSQYRWLLNAIMHEDELIGGSRQDSRDLTRNLQL